MAWKKSFADESDAGAVVALTKGGAPRFAGLLELSLGEQAALDGFDNRRPNGRPRVAAGSIANVERAPGRNVRPGRRGRKRLSDRATRIS